MKKPKFQSTESELKEIKITFFAGLFILVCLLIAGLTYNIDKNIELKERIVNLELKATHNMETILKLNGDVKTLEKQHNNVMLEIENINQIFSNENLNLMIEKIVDKYGEVDQNK